MTDTREVVTGVVLDERIQLSVGDLCRCCHVREEKIIGLIEEGILTPLAAEGGEARFPGTSARRAARALRLQRELELDLSGVAMVLELLEEVERLRRRLRIYEP